MTPDQERRQARVIADVSHAYGRLTEKGRVELAPVSNELRIGP